MSGPASRALVEGSGLGRKFSMGGEEIWAIRDVSLTVQRGEFLALIGRSGSGKTTLLNLLAGLDRPTSGTIHINGESITRCSEAQLIHLRRHTIGFVFQSFGLLPLLSVSENIEIALRIAGAELRDRRRRVEELLTLVGLAERAAHRPYELSGGEQQRVAIARALANRPMLILADEPTGELDSSTAASIFGLLRELVDREGVTIITATHDRTILDLTPRVEEMEDGRLLAAEERALPQQVSGERGVAARTPVAPPSAPDSLPQREQAAETSLAAAAESSPNFQPPPDVPRPEWARRPPAAPDENGG